MSSIHGKYIILEKVNKKLNLDISIYLYIYIKYYLETKT